MWRWVCASFSIDVGSQRSVNQASRFSSADGIGGPQNPHHSRSDLPMMWCTGVNRGRWRICLAYQSRRISSMSAPEISRLSPVTSDKVTGNRT